MTNLGRRSLSALVTAVLVGGGTSPALSFDPLSLYGRSIEFDVLRQGEKVGSHSVVFERRDRALHVHAKFEVAIRFLGMTVYDFDYRSRSEWRDARLVNLEVRVNDDGSKRWVRAFRHDDRLQVVTRNGQLYARPHVLPTDHWNPSVLGATEVLNTLTGKVDRVRIVDLGPSVVDTEQGPRPARHYRFTGELELEVWYDDAGRWVRLRFDSPDGSTIDYVCRRCGPAKTS